MSRASEQSALDEARGQVPMMIFARSGVSFAAAAFALCAGLSAANAASLVEPSAAGAGGASSAIRTVAAVTEAEDESANCSRSRRRLWVEGEGWIVRRVTTCR